MELVLDVAPWSGSDILTERALWLTEASSGRILSESSGWFGTLPTYLEDSVDADEVSVVAGVGGTGERCVCAVCSDGGRWRTEPCTGFAIIDSGDALGTTGGICDTYVEAEV